ncbi:hypothetical protein ACHAPA_006638 [Fusarium lateritium]
MRSRLDNTEHHMMHAIPARNITAELSEAQRYTNETKEAFSTANDRIEYLDYMWSAKMELAEIDRDEHEEQNLKGEINALERKLESHREKTRVKRVKATETIKVQNDQDWAGMLKMASQIDGRKD